MHSVTRIKSPLEHPHHFHLNSVLVGEEERRRGGGRRKRKGGDEGKEGSEGGRGG